MQEELSALKSELWKKDELINNMKEQLLHDLSSKGSHAKHLTCLETPTDNQQSPAVDEPHSSWVPHSAAPDNSTAAEALILIDSNKKICQRETLVSKNESTENVVPAH